MKGVWLVTRREIVTRGRSKSFLIGLLVSVVLVAVVAALPRLFGDTSYEVGLAGADTAPLRPALAEQAEVAEVDLTVTMVADEAAGRAAVADGELDAVVYGREVITDGAVDPQLSQLLETAHQAVSTEQRLREAGLDPAVVDEALAVSPLTYSSVGVDAEDAGVRLAMSIVVVLLMMMLVYMPAVYVATGVVEEKGSRVVELLLAAIRPWQLLAGKILGIGLLGFVQLAAIAGTGLSVAAVTGIADDLPPGVGGVVAGVFGWFVLGYAFFGTLAAAFGSLVSRQEDLGGVLTPVTALVMGAYAVGFLAVFNPDAALAHVLSIVPPFSVVVMPVRTTTGAVPAWEVALAVVLMLLATVAVLAAGARIYRRAVLRTGARVRLTEVLTAGARG